MAHAAHRALLAEFLDAVETGREPSCSGASALRVHRMIAALTESARQRRVVELAELAL